MKRMFAMSIVLCVLLLSGCNGLGDKAVDPDEYFREHYVDADAIPLLCVDLEREYVSDDRSLILNGEIENVPESIVYEYYAGRVSGSYQDAKNVVAGELLLMATENEEKQFKEGIYFSKITLEELDLMDKEEVDEISERNKQNIVNMLTELDMTEFAIVKVEKTIKLNDKYLSMDPQLRDGEYTRYFLLGKKGEYYKIVEVDWAGPDSWFPYTD